MCGYCFFGQSLVWTKNEKCEMMCPIGKALQARTRSNCMGTPEGMPIQLTKVKSVIYRYKAKSYFKINCPVPRGAH